MSLPRPAQAENPACRITFLYVLYVQPHAEEICRCVANGARRERWKMNLLYSIIIGNFLRYFIV